MPKRLLLADDEVHILRAAEFKLKRAGYDVRLAFDGEEAWDAIQEQLPDLLVTDYQMPRLNGLQLIARCRDHAHTATLPIALLTAKSLELDHEEVTSRFKVLGIFPKPFSPRELLARIEQVIGAAAMEQPSSALQGAL